MALSTFDSAAHIQKLKRKRSTIRSNATKFINFFNDVNSSTSLDDIEYYEDRLSETFEDLKAINNAIHDLLSDEEYSSDTVKCEEYTENTKRAIQKAKRFTHSSPSTQQVSVLPTNNFYNQLPTMKLEPFRGDVEYWQRFWEQFTSAVDSNSHLSTIDKHVFLRGYLEDEPKRLVDGISISAETYDITKQMLQERYGDKNRIIQAHVDFLDNMKPIRNSTPEALNEAYIEINTRIQALRALGENVDAYGRVLVPKILRSFPHEICKRWIIYSKREKISEADISKLMKFLNEVEGAMTTLKILGVTFQKSTFLPSTATLQVDTNASLHPKKYEPFCVFCEASGHWAQNCTNIVNVQNRIQKLKTSGRCFLCTNRGHNVKSCPRKNKVSCSNCKKKHHISICTQKPTPTTTDVGKIEVFPTFTYLQTARIWIHGPTGLRKLTRCILDSGSQSSFIHTNLVDKLQLNVSNTVNLSIQAFESSSNTSTTRRLIQFTISSIWNKTKFQITAFESKNSYSPHPNSPDIINAWAQIRNLKLADPEDDTCQLPIDVLIGGDYYWKIIKMWTTKTTFRFASIITLYSRMDT